MGLKSSLSQPTSRTTTSASAFANHDDTMKNVLAVLDRECSSGGGSFRVTTGIGSGGGTIDGPSSGSADSARMDMGRLERWGERRSNSDGSMLGLKGAAWSGGPCAMKEEDSERGALRACRLHGRGWEARWTPASRTAAREIS